MDPELEAFVPLFPLTDWADPVADRKVYAELAAGRPTPDISDLLVEDRLVPAATEVPVRLYRPRRPQGAVVWMHGGGLVVGDLDTEHPWAARIASITGAVVVSVGYRLAPEHPYPAALDDVWAVLGWTADHAAGFGVDPARIAVGATARGRTSRRRWRCGPGTKGARRSASSC